MSSPYNEMRIFEELRLHPWDSNSKRLIDAILARMQVEDPTRAAEFRRKYDEKMRVYLEAHPEEVKEEKVEEPKEVKIEEPKEQPKKPKKTRKPRKLHPISHE